MFFDILLLIILCAGKDLNMTDGLINHTFSFYNSSYLSSQYLYYLIIQEISEV